METGKYKLDGHKVVPYEGQAMSSIKKMKDIIIDLRKTFRMKPLGYGRMMEDGFNNLLSMLEAESEPAELIQKVRLIIQTAIQEGRETGYSPTIEEWSMISTVCAEINRLTAENVKLKDSFAGCEKCREDYEKEIDRLTAENKEKDEIIGTIHDKGELPKELKLAYGAISQLFKNQKAFAKE